MRIIETSVRGFKKTNRERNIYSFDTPMKISQWTDDSVSFIDIYYCRFQSSIDDDG